MGERDNTLRFAVPHRITIRGEAAPWAAGELERCLKSAGCEITREKAWPISLIRVKEGERDGRFRVKADPEGAAVESASVAGLVYGSFALLEEMGWRFLAADCELRPDGPLTLPEKTWEERPAFRVREVFWRSAMDGAFAVKLRLNSARSSITPEQGGKAMFYNFSHTFNTLVPPEEYFDTHPEYFSLVNGKRERERGQLCLTNPDVLHLCVQGVLQWKKDHPAYDIFSVAMNDWYGSCECPACRRIDGEEGSGAGTMIRFVNAVAEQVSQVYPDVRIHTFAYLYCRKPPRLTRPGANVIVRLCPIESCRSHPLEKCGCETGPIDVQYTSARGFSGDPDAESSFMRDLKGWSRICDNLFIWDYTTNYANYLQPFPNLNSIAENLRTFHRYGVQGVLEQGNFSRGRTGALGDLKVYLLGKLLWDPAQDEKALIREFAAGYWGNAAGEMLRLIEITEQAAQTCHMGIYDPPDAGYLKEDTLRAGEELLEAALRKTEGVYRERVEREMLSFRYVRLAQEGPDVPGHGERVDAFARDARRLGIAELFERRELEGSFECLRRSRLTKDRSMAEPITYPF